jgi:hypothetical protein
MMSRQERWTGSYEGFPFEPYLLDAEVSRAAAARFAETGVVVFGPPAIDPAVFEPLAAESAEQRRVANWLLHNEIDDRSSGQDTVRAHLGPLGRELMAAGATRALLQRITGMPVIPGWSATCLTYYDEPGQFLGAHRDKDVECHIAILVYLMARWPQGEVPGPGVQLHVLEPSDRNVILRVTACPNRIVVLHGSRLTHYRPPLAPGEAVGLLAGCFQRSA